MKRFILFLASLSLLVYGCANIVQTDDFVRHNDSGTKSYLISPEEALDNLTGFLSSLEELQTRALSLTVDDIIPINSYKDATRSIGNTTTLYAVNFPDDEGYALLSADSRVPETVVAFIEHGSVTIEDFEPHSSFEMDSDDDITEEMYNELCEAGYVGSQEGTGAIIQLCNRYAQFMIDNGEEFPDNPNPGHWYVSDIVEHKMTTTWTQSSPFNLHCPYVGLLKREKAPAGCVPIALGQIIAYHEYPSISISGTVIDYDIIKGVQSYSTSSDKWMASSFIKVLSSSFNCNVLYGKVFGYTFGFALPQNAKRTLENLGYDNVSLDWGYGETKVITSIDNNCPVFISAIAGIMSGHAWVIDGYIKSKYIDGNGVVTDSKYYVHCNWGWNGQNNGYFVSGVFKTDRPVFYDDTSLSNSETEDYWYLFNTITYDNPNE